MWAKAQELRQPVNFHIASGDLSLLTNTGHESAGERALYASVGVSFFLSNARTIANLTCGGICHRFPDLDFVSVESGVGWIPFALDALDWQWKNCGVAAEHPEYDLLPSEYFARQIYGCFWFEEEGAHYALERLGRRQPPVRDRLPAPDEHVAGAGLGRGGAEHLPREELRRPRARRPSPRSCTTTPPGSTSSTDREPERYRRPQLPPVPAPGAARGRSASRAKSGTPQVTLDTSAG